MNDTLQILEKVNTFYTASFLQLITYTGALLALVGVILPLAIALQQARQLKRDQASLEKTLEDHARRIEQALTAKIDGAIAEAQQASKKLIEENRGELAGGLKRLKSLTYGAAQHIQSENAWLSRNPERCVKEGVGAGRQYILAGDEHNLSIIFGLLHRAIPFLTKEFFENDPEIDSLIQRFRTAVDGISGSRWERDLQLFNWAIASSRKRPAFVAPIPTRAEARSEQARETRAENRNLRGDDDARGASNSWEPPTGS